MGKKGVLRAKLGMFYDKHNPGKIGDVPTLAKLFVNHESELNDKLRAAYEEDLTDMIVIDDPIMAQVPDKARLRPALFDFYETHAPEKANAPEFESVVDYYSVLPLFCLNRDLMEQYDDTVTMEPPPPRKPSMLRRASSRFSVSGSFGSFRKSKRYSGPRTMRKPSIPNMKDRDSREMQEGLGVTDSSAVDSTPEASTEQSEPAAPPPLPVEPAPEPVVRRTDAERRRFMAERMKSIKMKRSQLELLKKSKSNLGSLSRVELKEEEDEDEEDEEDEEEQGGEEPGAEMDNVDEAELDKAEAQLDETLGQVRRDFDVGAPAAQAEPDDEAPVPLDEGSGVAAPPETAPPVTW